MERRIYISKGKIEVGSKLENVIGRAEITEDKMIDIIKNGEWTIVIQGFAAMELRELQKIATIARILKDGTGALRVNRTEIFEDKDNESTIVKNTYRIALTIGDGDYVSIDSNMLSIVETAMDEADSKEKKPWKIGNIGVSGREGTAMLQVRGNSEAIDRIEKKIEQLYRGVQKHKGTIGNYYYINIPIGVETLE